MLSQRCETESLLPRYLGWARTDATCVIGGSDQTVLPTGLALADARSGGGGGGAQAGGGGRGRGREARGKGRVG